MATSTNDATTHARHTRKHKQSLVRRNHKRARHICHERARARATTTTTTATRTRTPARARNNADGEPRTAQRRTRTQYTFPSKETETTKRPRERERGAGERGELRRKGEREAKHRAVHGTLYRRWALEQTRSGAPLASAQYGSFWAGMRPYPARSLGRERSRGRDRAIYGRLAPRLYHSALVWQARTVATPCAPCAAAPLPLRPAPLFWCGGHLPLSPLLCRVALVLLVSSGAIRQEEQCCAGGENRARAAGCCTPPSFLSMPTNQPTLINPTYETPRDIGRRCCLIARVPSLRQRTRTASLSAAIGESNRALVRHPSADTAIFRRRRCLRHLHSLARPRHTPLATRPR